MPTEGVGHILTLNERHEYWLGDRQVLSTTALLREAGFIDTNWFTDEACVRGEYVHAAIELDLAGELESLDPRLQGYLDAARLFLQASAANIVATERPLADPVLGIAGKPDVIGHFFGRPGVVDWKTGQPANWHRYQLAIYRHLVIVNRVLTSPLISRFTCYLQADGTFTVAEHKDRYDWAVAQACITIAQAKRAA